MWKCQSCDVNNYLKDKQCVACFNSNDVFPPNNWNGEWLDFEENKTLKAYKQSLPVSIQRIIEWAQQLIGYNKIIDLDFNEIDQDLKYQYNKYNGDKIKLKKIYFNCNRNGKDDLRFSYKKSSDYDPTNYMFYDTSWTVIHFLFFMFRGRRCHDINGDNKRDDCSYMNIDKNKRVFIALNLLKLFIKNNIIDIDNILSVEGICGGSIWNVITKVAGDLNDSFSTNNNAEINIINNLHDFIELIMICMNQKQQKDQQAIFCIANHIELNAPYFSRNFYNRSYYKICDDVRIMEQLLFRGILPFQFYEVKENNNTYMLPIDNNNDIEMYMNSLFDEYKIYDTDNMNAIEIRGSDNKPKMPIPMIITSPLILLPYFNRCRAMMNHILFESLNNNEYIIHHILCKQICNVICKYLFVDYNQFYKLEIQNNINVQCMIFLGHLMFFGMDEQFMCRFNEKYNNKEFIKYIVDNYSYWIAIAIQKCDIINIDVIYSLIETYNDQNNKFPVGGHSEWDHNDGLYAILTWMLRRYSFSKSNKNLIDLLKLIGQSYENEFDFKFKYNDAISHGTYSPILLFRAFWHKDLELFQYLIVNYYNSSLDEVCNVIELNMNGVLGIFGVDYGMTEQDVVEQRSEYKKFIQDIKQFCLRSVCQNNDDCTVLTKCINDIWQSYINFTIDADSD